MEFVYGRSQLWQKLLREGATGGFLLHSQHVEWVPAHVHTGLSILHIVDLEE